jgi:hypothetical protein
MGFKRKIKEDTPQDRHFDPYRRPRTDKAKGLVADVLNQVQNMEKHHELLKRKRKPAEQAVFEQRVTAVISDVTHRWITEKGGDACIAVPYSNRELSKAGRYRSPVLKQKLRDVIQNLASPAMLFLEFQLGYFYPFGINRQSTIKVGRRLIPKILALQLSPNDFTSDLAQEVIILKRSKEGYYDTGEWIGYEDTDVTRRYREEMRKINEWLTSADIHVLPEFAALYKLDDYNRILRRHFNNNSFELGGRLFGGFWQSMKKHLRPKCIRINGEPIVTLDYSQMNPRLLYAKADLTPPEGDLYAIPGWSHWRAGLKKVFSTMLNVDKPLERFPLETKELFHNKAKIKDIVNAIVEFHRPVSHYFFTHVGLELMFRESQILVDILLKLQEMDVVALPIHDAVVVAQSDADKAHTVMVETFERHTGVAGKVDREC